jgi:hypothetical protein
MQATLRDANGNTVSGRTVRWTTSNPAVATIDSVSGLLTGIDRGTVTVTATSEGKSGSASRVIVIKYRSVTAGTMHACDIASGGIAWCWGLNGAEGRLGSDQLGSESMSTTPYRVPGNHRFVQLATFGRHTCGITVEGKAYCWGYNGWGSLGGGANVSQSPTPILVGSMTFRSITTGADHTCAVSTDNVAYCWGNNDWRQLGTGNSTISSTPVAVSGGISFAAITAGVGFTCGIASTSAAAYCWGANGLGQTGDGKPINYGNVFVAAHAARRRRTRVQERVARQSVRVRSDAGRPGVLLGKQQRQTRLRTNERFVGANRRVRRSHVPLHLHGLRSRMRGDHVRRRVLLGRKWQRPARRHSELQHRSVRAGDNLTAAEVAASGIATARAHTPARFPPTA